MKIRKSYSWIATTAACAGMLPSPAVLAAPTQAATVSDVALAEGGVLSGQVVDAQGIAVPQAPVTVLADGRELVRLASNAEGAFAVAGLTGGVYEVATPGHHAVYRLWSPHTAPPAAGQGVMLVSGGEVVRGQYGYGPPPPPAEEPGLFGKTVGMMSNHPFITAGVIATAIAVPLAVSEFDDAS